jgi:hypothetical protein
VSAQRGRGGTASLYADEWFVAARNGKRKPHVLENTRRFILGEVRQRAHEHFKTEIMEATFPGARERRNASRTACVRVRKRNPSGGPTNGDP